MARSRSGPNHKRNGFRKINWIHMPAEEIGDLDDERLGVCRHENWARDLDVHLGVDIVLES